MKISKNWLQKYFDKKLPSAEALSDLFTFHFCEVEGIEKVSGSENDGKAENDEVLDLKILPDRAHYALCHKGVAEEISALLNLPLKEQKEVTVAEVETKRKISVNVVDKNFCPRYMARVVENVKVTDSPAWLKEKMEALGARSINNIVDATNYVMFDIGQPLHAFDADKVVGNITVRPAKSGEKITTLDGKEITLTSDDSVIADDKGALAIAGVKGGIKAEVTKETKNIIIESANFNASSVRKTSVRVGIKNDAVKRYENAITPELTEEAMKAVSEQISESSKSAVFGRVVDGYSDPVKPWSVTVTPEFINEKIGSKISTEEIVKILEKLNIDVAKGSSDSELLLTIPTKRLDLIIPEDVAEEVGRIYGYEKVESQPLPLTNKKPEINKSFYYSEKIKNVLAGLGFNEVYLYSLVATGDYEVTYPLASDKAFLRKNLSDGMIKCVEKGVINAPLLGLDIIKVFEIGKVFTKNGEELHLCISMKAKKAEGMIKEALKVCGIDDSSVARTAGMTDHGGIKVNNLNGISLCEINLGSVIEKMPTVNSYDDLGFAFAKKVNYKKFSLYPFIVRDIAFFVPEEEEKADKKIEETAWKVIADSLDASKAMHLITCHALFDIFKKDGKISYAFRLVFQANDRTLSDEEVNPIMQKIYDAVAEKGWQIR
ncbi:MAG: phenylalanine--tRNA ligase subunit beta [Candidatus Taylorbacteria bacterium]|nr:phenylalanine--tRNA ligase subunit beta [Candidatus Taylorbacteria bacterium]